MKYKMHVVIENPEPEEGRPNEISMDLTAEFACNKDDYGNGHHLYIEGENGFEVAYDIRYDTDFDEEHKGAYLVKWAENYWSGKNGAYSLKMLRFEEA